jgi:hypothetical protein
MSELELRRKWTVRAHGKQIVLVKRAYERSTHVLMKAFLWALYLPMYPDLTVEIRIGDRYKPDLVALDERGQPHFWAEAGEIGKAKIRSLLRRYRNTHFALAKWDTSLDPLREIVRDTLTKLERRAPVDLLSFPPDSVERFVGERGSLELTFDDLERIQLGTTTGSISR